MVALNLSSLLAANNTTFLSKSNFTATAGQVKFASNYTVGYVEVYQNGLRLADSDFTAANGEHVLLDSAASINDNIDIIGHKATNISGAALPTTTMTAGTGLTGGGNLSANRTFNLNLATVALANTNAAIATKTTTTTNFSTANLTSTAGFITTAGANPRVTINATSGNPGINLLEGGTNGIIMYYSTTANQFVIGQNGTADWFKMDDGTGLVTLQGSAVVQQGMPVRQAGGNNVTLALGDNGKLIWCVNTASAMNIHIPTNASVAFPIGAEMTFLQKLTHATANTLGFSAAAGVTLDSKEAANTVADRHTAATLKKLATNTWILIGNLS